MKILQGIKEDIKTNKKVIIIVSIFLVFLILITTFGEDSENVEIEPDKYKFSYSINIAEVEIVNGIPFLYTSESGEEDQVLYYPAQTNWYFYKDSLDHTWMAQGEMRKRIRQKHYFDITNQTTLKVYMGKVNFIKNLLEEKYTPKFYVENIEGDMILLVPDPNGVVKTRNFLIESGIILDRINEEIKVEREEKKSKKSKKSK